MEELYNESSAYNPIYKTNAFAIFLSSFYCDKNCPYCIAKDCIKFLIQNEDFAVLETYLRELLQNKIQFRKFVLSGNGEPTLYCYEQLNQIVKLLKKYRNLFENIRLYTSGNVFFDERKFELINSVFNQYNLFILSFDDKINMQLCDYDKDIWTSEKIREVDTIKLDIGLTKNLDINNFVRDLEEKLENNQNIRFLKLKTLKTHGNSNTNQHRWIDQNKMSIDEMNKLRQILMARYGSTDGVNFKITPDVSLVYNEIGKREKYDTWVLWNCIQGFINYEEQPLTIDNIKSKSMKSKQLL